ncbi:YceI family protein [Streptomyces hainanensis]|uniref:YceI family protein n=1 Tax=Streptomyces hainanensis TaxID=402648 RepID=A0A4R4SR21_9ACTN|nr:YceI family protein [Streptomyces hainanensis]TDC66351.1 YceI family protein [Streptomyces hainanensis]
MTVAVRTGTWQLDPAASRVGISHRGMWGLITVRGAFATVGGRGEVTADGAAAGVVTLDAASLDTGHAKRDGHLRGAGFFDAEHHPEITLAVDGAERTGDDTVRAAGRLTVRGVSRPITVSATLADVADDALTLTTEFTVDRAEFGVGRKQLGMMPGLTTVTATLRFTRAAG